MSTVIQNPRPLSEEDFLEAVMSAAEAIAEVVLLLQATVPPAPMLGALLTVFGNAAIAGGLSREQTVGFIGAYETELVQNWERMVADFVAGNLLFSPEQGGAS